MKNDVRLFGLIGHPLHHSFSKAYFDKKFNDENLDCKYKNFDIENILELSSILKNNNLIGFNVTIPHKVSILNLLDKIQDDAKEIGAVNVVKVQNKELIGFNTDYLAFKYCLNAFLEDKVNGALVLGSGGASKAINYALTTLKINSKIVSRSGNGDLSYAELDKSILSDFNLIINTTPLGTFPEVESRPFLPYHLLNKDHYLYDLVYNPSETQFMKKGRLKGCKTSNGYEMLVKQAELSWDIWNQ